MANKTAKFYIKGLEEKLKKIGMEPGKLKIQVEEVAKNHAIYKNAVVKRNNSNWNAIRKPDVGVGETVMNRFIELIKEVFLLWKVDWESSNIEVLPVESKAKIKTTNSGRFGLKK